MPWGFSGFSSRQPAPQRLTLEELLGMQDSFAPPPRPAPITSVRDLQGSDRRDAQMNSVWAALASLGTGVSTGNWQAAGRGIGDIQAAQQGAVDQANARQMGEWQERAQAQAAEAEQAKLRQEKGALFGMYEEVAEGESEPFVVKAEQAARTGSMSELEKLREQKPQRAAARAKGFDPDAWETNKRLQADLEAELEAAKRRSLIPVTVEEKTAAGKAENELSIEEQEELRRRKLGTYKPPEYEPLSRVAQREEIVQSIRDKHQAAAGGIKGRLGQAPGGQWGWISPPSPENPSGKFTPIDGQPQAKGKAHLFTVSGVPYAIDTDHPEQGAVELPMRDLGDPPPVAPRRPAPLAPKPGAGKPAPAPAKAPVPPKAAAAASRKLAAVKDAGTKTAIQQARASGYSDSEIASFLGLH